MYPPSPLRCAPKTHVIEILLFKYRLILLASSMKISAYTSRLCNILQATAVSKNYQLSTRYVKCLGSSSVTIQTDVNQAISSTLVQEVYIYIYTSHPIRDMFHPFLQFSVQTKVHNLSGQYQCYSCNASLRTGTVLLVTIVNSDFLQPFFSVFNNNRASFHIKVRPKFFTCTSTISHSISNTIHSK